jgi:hypothetical protein
MLGARTFPGNPYDGYILSVVLEQATNLTQGLGLNLNLNFNFNFNFNFTPKTQGGSTQTVEAWNHDLS